MKNFILSFLCVLCLPGYGFTLSDEAEISILTCSPGAELYSLFGHTAIRVEDPEKKTDVVFNYGTFNFNTPYFYLKYARGLLPYQLTISNYDDFIASYEMDNRTVYAQLLNLDAAQKQKLFDLLLENYQPANRSYLYNFLYDNCTTRSRDVILNSLADSVQWNLPDADKSFWNLLDEYLRISPWVQWGIHTILGQGGNKEATTFQYMFLPDYLMAGLKTARYNGRHLAQEPIVLYQATEMITPSPWYMNPLFIFAVGVFLLLILLQRYRSVGLFYAVAFSFFLFTGLLGCLIVFLGAFTAHPITAPNWNILWANPFNLFVLLFMFRENLPLWIRGYLKVYLALLVIAVPAWAILQPAVPVASIFLILFMIYLCLRLRSKK